MSSYQTHNYSQPRDCIPVYRCQDNHWHFFPDKHTKTTPWHRQQSVRHPSPSLLHTSKPPNTHTSHHHRIYQLTNQLTPQQPPNARKFPDDFSPVYAKGCADQPYTVDCSYESGFYSLRDYRDEVQLCVDVHRPGRGHRQLWREEELSATPWGGAQGTRLPAYEQSSAAER